MAEEKGSTPITTAGLVSLGGRAESPHTVRFGGEVAVVERGAVYIGTHCFNNLEAFGKFLEINGIPKGQS